MCQSQELHLGMRRINPSGMYDPPGGRFSQVVESTGGRHVYVAGTIAADEEGTIVGDTVEAQTKVVLENIETSLEAADATPSDVVRNTIYATDASAFLEEGYDHVVEFFGTQSLPASALIGVDHLAHPDFLVEIESTAIVDE